MKRKSALVLFWLFAITAYQITKLVIFLDRKFKFKLPFPGSIDELKDSSEWCFQTLVKKGAIPKGSEFVNFSISQPNPDLIFRSDTVLCSIDYRHNDNLHTLKIVAKFSPSQGSVSSRVVYNLQQNHVKEVNFINELSPQFNTGLLPKFYFAELHELTANMCILMEYLEDYVEFNEFEGCPEHLLPVVVKNMAEMHATYWNIKNEDVKGIVAIPQIVADFFESQNWFTWSKQAIYVFRRCWETINTDQTVIHGDARVGNLMFQGEDPTQMAFIDWQGTRMSKAVFDVAYFLILSVDIDLRIRCEHELLKHYHETLCNAGINDYSFESLQDDYNYSSLLLLTMLATPGLTAEGSFDESSDGLMIFVLGYKYWYDRVKSKVDTLHSWTAEKFNLSVDESKAVIDEILSHYKNFLDKLQDSAYPNKEEAKIKFAEIEERIAAISSKR